MSPGVSHSFLDGQALGISLKTGLHRSGEIRLSIEIKPKRDMVCLSKKHPIRKTSEATVSSREEMTRSVGCDSEGRGSSLAPDLRSSVSISPGLGMQVGGCR